MKKIDIHAHATMWENTQIRPGISMASPEQIKNIYDELDITKDFFYL